MPLPIVKRSQTNKELDCSTYDSNLDATLDRGNHTGVQKSDTIYDLYDAVHAFDYIAALELCCSQLRTSLANLQEELFGEGELNTIINNLRAELIALVDALTGQVQDVAGDLALLTTRVAVIESSLSTIVDSIQSLSNSTVGFLSQLALKANKESPIFTGTPKAPTPPLTSKDTSLATTAFVRQMIPAGVMVPYAGYTAVPPGWALCDGSAVSRSQYIDLFTAIQTAYGVGDGSTTFNLPNMASRVPIGVGASPNVNYTHGATGGTDYQVLDQSQLPNHSHFISDPGHVHSADPGLGRIRYKGYNYFGGNGNISFNSGMTEAADDSQQGQRHLLFINLRQAFRPDGVELTPFDIRTFNTNPATANVSTTTSGASAVINNMPPYICVFYLIKL